MEEPGEPRADKPKNKSGIYIWLGVLFLLLMALTSSIDKAFVYVFLGLSVFFFFIGLKDKLTWKRRDGNTGNYDRGNANRGRFSGNQDTFSKQRTQSHQTHQASPVPDQKKKVGIAVFIFFVAFLSIFGSVFFATIFSESAYTDETFSYQVGYDYFNSGQYDSALVNYRRAFRIKPDYVEALHGYGRTLFEQKQYDSALIMFDKVLAIDPQYIESLYFKAVAYYNKEQYDQSLQQAEAVIAINPDYNDAMLVAGDCYYIRKQYDPAMEWYEKAYANDARSRNLCWVMAFIHDQKGNKEKAISFYRETLSYDSSIVEIYTRLGELIPDQEGNFFRTKAAQLQQSQ